MELVGGESVINGAYPVRLVIACMNHWTSPVETLHLVSQHHLLQGSLPAYCVYSTDNLTVLALVTVTKYSTHVASIFQRTLCAVCCGHTIGTARKFFPPSHKPPPQPTAWTFKIIPRNIYGQKPTCKHPFLGIALPACP